MSALATAPGVVRTALITYLTPKDVKALLGCRDSKAYSVIRMINEAAKVNGNIGYGAGKCNKYLFSEKFGIPIEVIDQIIENNTGR